MKDDRIVPIEERIAQLFGRGVGFGGVRGGKPEKTSSDLAQALGAIADEYGNLVAMVLETKYASTLMHERSLCAGWEAFAKKSDPGMQRETISFSRHACILAIHEIATGKKASRQTIDRAAWLLGVRRVGLEAAVWLIVSWFDDLRRIGVVALQKRFKNTISEDCVNA